MTKFMLQKFIQSALLLVVLFTTVQSYAQVSQAPDGIQFQALATDANGHPAAGRVIYVKDAIIAKTATGTIVYSETFKVTASSAGIFTIVLGKGTYAGGVSSIANIDWANGPFFLNLKIAVEPTVPTASWNVNNEYVDLGTSQFWSVPYALYAGSVKGLDTKLNIADTAAMLKPYFTAINLKANIESPTFTGTVSGVTKTHVGLGNVDNTTDALKPVSTATQTALDAKLDSLTASTTYAPLSSPTFTGTVTLPANTISQSMMSDDSVGTNEIVALAVTEGKIADGAITNAKVSATAAIATSKISGLDTALGLLAPIASPTFTGTVAGITKGMVGLGLVDNTADTSKPVSTAQASAIATAKSEAIADATSQVNALLTGAPAALNTLDELAAALGDDANFASTVTTSLAAKTPELYTFTPDATTTRVLALGDKFASIKFTGATATSITVPTNASVAFPVGTYIEFYQFGAGQLTVTAVTPGTTSIRSTDSQNKSRTQYSSMVLVKVDTDEWLLTGDLTA